MSEILVDTLTGKTTANDITVTVGASVTQSLEQGLAKGWCSFNGQSATLSFYDSLNGSSLTDGGTGDYTMNLSNAMSDVYFPASFNLNARNQSGTPVGSHPSTSGCQVRCTNTSDSNNDNSFVQMIFHGDLA